MMAGHRPEAIEQETVQPVSTPTFLERAEGLKKAVEAHRALSDAVRRRRVKTYEYGFVCAIFK